jgi:pimeloyl-ACP methyl ester carboxylesterase
MDRNIELTPQLENAKIEQPAFFIAGSKDLVLRYGGGGLLEAMNPYLTDLRGKVLVDGAGHWVQAERPEPVNEALLGFLKTVS